MEPRKFWNAADEAKLALLAAKGEPVVSIAKEMGRTPQAIAQRARMLKIHFSLVQRGKRSATLLRASTPFGRLF